MERYYRQLENIHINCEEPRAYFIPFENENSVLLPREKSGFFTLLNGEWDFRFFPDVEELEIEDEGFTGTVECNGKMPVPFCWQLFTDRGYDVPNYINQDYPYPVDPPYLPDVIPCGFYRRKSEIRVKAGKSYFINFEGVASCFYLWVNGAFVGYSQVSHCTSEFNITDFLKDGENVFEVLVIKHCTGSYMEDQDFFRLSGIFRDVYILERDASHIEDILIKPCLSADFSTAQIVVTTDFSGEIDWKLLSPGNEEIQSGNSKGSFALTLRNPVLWNPENPVLYTLVIRSGSEYIAFPVGIKRAEIINGVFLLNGEKMKIRGINRHDTDPETGYCVSVEEMLKDLISLRCANVNAIRTSHYPNDPRFAELCDRLGFVLIDEADLETHGMGYNYGDWYWDYWAHLCDTPEWKDACIDRIKRLFERDKNRACVIMWSLGNESGCGENHRLMANYIRSRDDRAIIHYENARLEYETRVNRDFKDISDVESRMYASLDYLREYLADPEMKKPFFYCEYVSAWSTGDIPLHWGEFERNDKYMGGCIWEYKDHSVNIGTKEKPKYRYGGDFGDKPNDGIYCVDGLVHPDRRPRPGYEEMKQTYKPFAAVFDNGVLTIVNRNFFTPLTGVTAVYTIEKDGRETARVGLGTLNIEKGGKALFPVQVPETEGNITLNVYVNLAEDTYYAKKGYTVGFEQFVIQKAPVKLEVAPAGELGTEETRNKIRVITEKAVYTFSKTTGKLVSVFAGRELLAEPGEFSVYRAYLPNCSDRTSWERARYNDSSSKCYSCTLKREGQNAVITVEASIAAAAMPPALMMRNVFTVSPEGILTVQAHVTVTGRAPVLPRFGYKLVLNEGIENLEYLGCGERETYADRHSCARFSLYKTTTEENFEHYVRPTECSSHYGTLYAKVYGDDDSGLEFAAHGDRGVQFSAKPYSDKMLMETMHDDELVGTGKTYVNIDYRIHGENTANRELCPERVFGEKCFAYAFDILPL